MPKRINFYTMLLKRFKKNLIDKDELPIREVCRVVAAEKNLDSDALRAAFRRSEKNEGKRHGNAILIDEEEKTIVGFILAFDMNSLPLTNKKNPRSYLSCVPAKLFGKLGF